MKSFIILVVALTIPWLASAKPPSHAGGPPIHASAPWLDASSETYLLRHVGPLHVARAMVSTSCASVPPTVPCVEAEPAPAITVADFPGLIVVELPAGSFSERTCFESEVLRQITWQNSTGSNQTSLWDTRVVGSVESVAFDGVPELSGEWSFLRVLSLASETRAAGEQGNRVSRRGHRCSPMIETELLRDVYGLTDADFEVLYSNPVTLKFGLSMRTGLVTFKTASLRVQILSD